MIIEDQNAQIAFLSDPSSYGQHVGKVDRIETHGAVVFLAGDRAYKLKRAVRFPYMDFSTPDRRRRFALAELAINRRTAPSLYLGVRAIVRAPSGALAFGESDRADGLDWVVMMRRFAQDDQFDRLAKAGRLTEPLARELADAIARFHDAAEPCPSFGAAESYRELILGIAEEFRRHTGTVVDAASVARWESRVQSQLDRAAPAIERRRRDGHVRRCHGDLHLANICLLDGSPTPFDAIEFNDSFACSDTFYDLAFLLMDLDSHKLRPLANTVFNRYLERRPRDFDALTALPLFLSCRAAIRTHVAASTAATAGLSAEMATVKRQEALLYLARSLDYLAPPPARLIAIGGPSGSGKSTLARRLAPQIGAALGAVVPRSDVIRKSIMGADELAALPPAGYTSKVSDQVFAELGDRTGLALGAGHSVIADAVFGTRPRRQAIAATAARHGAKFDGIWLQAPGPLLESRVTHRRGDASDATASIVRRQLTELQTPEVDEPAWTRCDSTGNPDDVAQRARRHLGDS
ncbi:MAG: hypothetical protein FJX52_01415 [Alphaproteobacteria bacterium]|nr:hypothetical protein [Alphaproteobacteria bacterium]